MLDNWEDVKDILLKESKPIFGVKGVLSEKNLNTSLNTK